MAVRSSRRHGYFLFDLAFLHPGPRLLRPEVFQSLQADFHLWKKGGREVLLYGSRDASASKAGLEYLHRYEGHFYSRCEAYQPY